MFRRLRELVAPLSWLLGLLVSPVAANDLDRDEEVVFFPTSVLLDPAARDVTLFVHGWVYEPEHDSLRRQAALRSLVEAFELDADAATEKLFVDRARRFLVDNERNQRLTIRLGSREVTLSPSEPNGHVRAQLTLPAAEVRRWATTPGRAPAVLDFRVVTPSGDARVFTGRIHLVGPEGWSIVSDIDDTIKASNVLDRRELLRNTLVREFQPVAGMAEAYQDWQREGAAFHYVSGSPWQLYSPLAEFCLQHRFPSGSFQLRYFRVQDGSALDLLAAPDVYKREAIEQLLKDFPRRKFILVGDTGEKDPEVYGDLARRFPERVRLVALRNVTDEALAGLRFQAALRGVPENRIVLFRDAAELPKPADLNGK